MSVEGETQKAIDAATHLTAADSGVVAVLLRLARAVDDIDEDGLNPAGKLDNVSIPTYLKYAEALSLTPAARNAAGIVIVDAKGGAPSGSSRAGARLEALKGGKSA